MTDEAAPRTWLPAEDHELLSTDSGEIVFVDLATACDVLHDLPRHFDTPQWVVPRVAVVGSGISCGVGGDGAFGFEVRGSEVACHAMDIWCDEPGEYDLTWQEVGTIDVASGVLLVADPYLLDQYTVEAHDGPLLMGGLWMELRLPVPGQIVVERGMHAGTGLDDIPAVIRARWLP